MRSRQLAAQLWGESPVGQTERARQSGTAQLCEPGMESHMRAELVAVVGEGMECFFGLMEEFGVRFEVCVKQGIVDMDDACAAAGKLLTEKDILVTVAAEGLVEPDGEEERTADSEVERTKGAVGVFVASGNREARLGGLFVAVAQGDGRRGAAVGVDDAAADDVGLFGQPGGIACEEVRVGRQAVAVEEE